MTKPPNLEDVSKTESTPESQERRRLPRLCLSGEQFRLSQNGKIFAVVDLSTTGMSFRLLDSEDLRIFSIAAVIQGQLNLNRQKFPVTARIKNVRPDIVGCEFENLPPKTEAALKLFLDPDALGQELRPIPASGTDTMWFHGPSGTDVLLWRAPGKAEQYQRLTIYIQGSYVQWESEGGVTTGRTESSEERSQIQGIVRLETMMLIVDDHPDAGKLTIAKNLLLSSNIPQDLKKWCILQLESSRGSA